MAEHDPCCDVPYPLDRGGTTATGRDAPALDPATVRLDPRDLPGLLRWAMAYAEHLRHIERLGPDGVPTEAVPFRRVFGVDPLITLAEIEAIDPARYAEEAAAAEPDDPADPNPVENAWSRRLRRWADGAPRGSEMAETLDRVSARFASSDIEGQRIELERLQDRAPGWWATYQGHWPQHAPHVALLIAALRLYGHSQRLLDALVGRHMNYGYETVLGFTRRPPQPDRAHLIIELARHVTACALPAGTVFSGKDSAGQPARFALTEEVGFGRATVAAAYGLTREPAAEASWLRCRPLTWPRPAAVGWPNHEIEGDTARAAVGLAVASPVLRVSAGARRIGVTFELAFDEAVGVLPSGFGFKNMGARYSTPDGWHDVPLRRPAPHGAGGGGGDEPGPSTLGFGGGALTLSLNLTADDPPLAAATAADGPRRFATDLPVVQLHLGDALPPALYAATVEKVVVEVSVEGLIPTAIHGPGGSGDPEGTFMPFGPQPRRDDVFYIEHPELHGKPLSQVSMRFRPVGQTDMETIYAGYGEDGPQAPCTVQAHLRRGDGWQAIGEPFEWGAAAGGDGAAGLADDRQHVGGSVAEPAGANRGELCWALQTDLLHDDWSRLLTEKAIQLGNEMQARSQEAQNAATVQVALGDAITQHIATLDLAALKLDGNDKGKGVSPRNGSIDAALDAMSAKLKALIGASDEPETRVLPGPPMVLRAAELMLGYRAKETVFDSDPSNTGVGALFRVGPLGATRVMADATLVPPPADPDPADASAATLLPRFDRQSAALYLALDGLTAPTTLTLLIQVLEGSEDPAASGHGVEWHALTTEGWAVIEPLRDSTDGLLRSGLVQLPLPANMDPDPFALPGGSSWLALTIPRRDDDGPAARTGACTVLDIRAQAAEVVRIDATGAIGAPPESITRLAERRAEIRAVQQPYAAFGGRPAEGDVDFHRRVAERLRHKDRAVTPWDYERLVLDAFPQVFKVRCLIHSRIDLVDGVAMRRHAPGHVTLVLVGRLPDRFAADPLRPRVSATTRLDITRFVEARAPIGATVQVIDARYVPVTVTADVLYAPGAEGYGPGRVQAALIAHLAPWTAADPIEPAFGGEVHASRLLAVIDAVPGVVAAKRLSFHAAGKGQREHYRPAAPHIVITSASTHVLGRANTEAGA